MKVKEFLASVCTNLDEDSRYMVESGYYEDFHAHYELIFGNDDEVTNETEIIKIEES